MRKDDFFKVMLTVAAVSLIANLLQYRDTLALERKYQGQIARAHVADRMRAMEARANAFYALVLGNENPLAFRKQYADLGDELTVEFGVRVPCEKRTEFLEWMANWDGMNKSEPVVHPPGYAGGESAYRKVSENGVEFYEIYEKASFEWK